MNEKWRPTTAFVYSHYYSPPDRFTPLADNSIMDQPVKISFTDKAPIVPPCLKVVYLPSLSMFLYDDDTNEKFPKIDRIFK